MISRRDLIATAVAAATTSVAGTAFAQTFPSRPLRIVVPFPPGGTGDVQARLIGEFMSRELGQPVVVENKPGAGTIIGTQQVAQAAPDGHTLLLMANSFVINAKLRGASLPYPGLKAFEPVACLTNSPQAIAVNSATPWRTFKEWMDAVKAKPDTVSYSAFGPATAQHIAAEILVRAAGLRMTYVPFPGGAPAVNAALAGHVQTVLANVNEIQAHAESGKLRMLAVTTPQRLAALPNVPTVSESGVPGYEAAAWFGLCVPAGTPKDVVARLSRAAANAVSDAEIGKRLVAAGLQPYVMDPARFAAHINEQFALYSKVIDEAGIKA
ncbi:MAG: Bug family tripartite tricarboxylate transporter substrate binding protein [Burkholderiaceae bacterium]